MSLPAQLRAIADRLEAAEAERAAALDELWQIRTVDSASVLEADGDQAGASAGVAQAGSSGSPVPPIQQPGQVPAAAPRKAATGGSPAPAFDPLGPKAGWACIEHNLTFTTPQGLGAHRRHVHGHKAQVKAPATCPDCGKRIAHGQNLARHRQMVHGGQKRTNGAAAPVMRKGAESWVCNRCPESFLTREARDLHQSMHPPVPMPVVGQRAAQSPNEAAQRLLRG